MTSTRISALIALLALGTLAKGIQLPSIGGGDAPLEPSIENEVDHALYLGEKWLRTFNATNLVQDSVATNTAIALPADLFTTNSLSREAVALKLVRSQRAGGYWTDPRPATITNRVPSHLTTRLALSILSSL